MKNQRLLLEGAALIDGTGGPVIENSTVLIEGNRITYAARRGSTMFPPCGASSSARL